jgi:hypothetical protein
VHPSQHSPQCAVRSYRSWLHGLGLRDNGFCQQLCTAQAEGEVGGVTLRDAVCGVR